MKLAIAVSQKDTIENQHFGDADKFMLFEVKDEEVKFLSEQANPYKGMHGHHGHGNGQGHGKKAALIIGLLRDQGAEVLVSRQFGPNIREVCRHFVPVLISASSTEEAKGQVLARLPGLEKELGNNTGEHNILRIMEDGVLVIPLKKE